MATHTRGVCTFRKTDARRAVGAAHKAGLKVTGIEYAPDGTIRLTVEDGSMNRLVNRGGNEWDEVFDDTDGTH